MTDSHVHRGPLSTDPVTIKYAGKTVHLAAPFTYLGHPVVTADVPSEGPIRSWKRSRFDRRTKRRNQPEDAWGSTRGLTAPHYGSSYHRLTEGTRSSSYFGVRTGADVPGRPTR